MAKAYTQDEFDSLMEKVEKVDIRVKDYLELAGYERWARLYAPVNRGWTMTSNIVESINSVIPLTEHLHMVNDEGKHYTVCLLEKTCSCGRFQVDELPCPHALAILKSKFLMSEEYCLDYWKPKSVVTT
nr:uncharacterized protein LOC104104173 [Nicotiana tomentosiformis]